MFSGALSTLALYALARIYWVVFSGPLDPGGSVRDLWLGVGTLTTLLGGIMCFSQRNLKRLLAFSTISHMGMLLIGLALLDPSALAGTALYAVGHGLIKGTLFLTVGIVLHRLSTVDELALRGRGRGLPYTGILFTLSGGALAGLPPFVTSHGKAMIEHTADASGLAWVSWVLLLGTILTGGAVLRAAGRIFLGWGSDHTDATPSETDLPETRTASDRTPWMMIAPATVLLAGAMALGLIPRPTGRMIPAATRFEDRTRYINETFDGFHLPTYAPVGTVSGDSRGIGASLTSTAGAVILAICVLFRHRLPAAPSRLADWSWTPLVSLLRPAQRPHRRLYDVAHRRCRRAGGPSLLSRPPLTTRRFGPTS